MKRRFSAVWSFVPVSLTQSSARILRLGGRDDRIFVLLLVYLQFGVLLEQLSRGAV